MIKKLTAACLCCTLVSTPVFAQEQLITLSQTQKIEQFQMAAVTQANDRMWANQSQQQERKDPLAATGLNILPFGLGSFYQGDQVGGTVLAVMDGLAVLLLYLGSVIGSAKGGWAGTYEISASFVLFVAARITGVVLPWVYDAHQFNQTHPHTTASVTLYKTSF